MLSLKEPRSVNILAGFLVFAAIFLFFHDLFYGKIIATNDISTNDLLYFYLPVKKLYSDALQNWELLQWTPNIYGGFPIFAEGQGGFLYPLNLVIWYLLSPVAAMNSYIIFHAFLMGYGVYLLVSKLIGNKLISIPSGVAASICGSIIAGHTRHLNSLTAIVYLPILIYFVELFLRSKKLSHALVFGLLLGLLVLGGHPQHSFISAFFAIMYLLFRILFDKSKKENFLTKLTNGKVFYFLIISFVVMAVIGLPQVYSTMQLLPFTDRGRDLGPEFTGIGSLPFDGILTFIYPYYAGNMGNMTYRSEFGYEFWEFFYYSGAIIFALAIYGGYKMRKRKEFYPVIVTLVLIAVISYLLALGENLGVYKIFKLFPFTKSFRFQGRWLAGMEFSVLVLSGFGVLAIYENLLKPKLSAGSKAESKSSKKESSAAVSEKSLSLQLKIVLVVTLLAVTEIYMMAGKQVVTADSSVYLNPPSYVNMINRDNNMSSSARLLSLNWKDVLMSAYSKSGGWEGRHDMFGFGAKLMPPDLAAYFGMKIIDGYLLLVPNYNYEVWASSDNQGIMSMTAHVSGGRVFQPTDKFQKMSRLFGVKYLVTFWSIPKPYEQVWDSAGLRLYKAPGDFPKAWVVSDVKQLPGDNDKQNALALLDSTYEPEKSALISTPVNGLPSDSRNGTADVISYNNHSLSIRANAPGFVVINESWYPGWKAYIDGEEVPLYKTNIMMRGVVAPKAGTIIEMRFETSGVLRLAFLSYLSMILIVGFLVYEKIKTKKAV